MLQTRRPPPQEVGQGIFQEQQKSHRRTPLLRFQFAKGSLGQGGARDPGKERVEGWGCPISVVSGISFYKEQQL
jgi:hypothetical protein